MRRLLLVPHAATAATRVGAFPLDEPLDARGRAACGGLAVPSRCAVLVAPAVACRETASAAGLFDFEVDPGLADCDYGAWAGRSLEELSADALAAWRTDPDARPHGGESLAAFAARVGAWLDAQAVVDGVVVGITHASVVRAALVHALGAPLDAFWRIDAAPLSVSELHAREGRWTVTRVNAAVAEPTRTPGHDGDAPARLHDAAGRRVTA
jgi:broad specificity phosphatase PhoE